MKFIVFRYMFLALHESMDPPHTFGTDSETHLNIVTDVFRGFLTEY